MTVSRLISRILRRPASILTTVTPAGDYNLTNPFFSNPVRSFAFNSAEEAAAERRRRKRQLRQQPPPNSTHRDPNAPRPRRDPNQPDTTSALVGPRLGLHNRVQSLIRAGDIDNATAIARQSVFSSIRPTVFTCNSVIDYMYRANRYSDAIALFTYFFKQSNIIPNVVSYNLLIAIHCENSQVDKALEVYEHIMDYAPFTPSAVTFRHLTKGLIDIGRIDEAVTLLWKMLGDGHGADSDVFNNIISGFLNLGNLEKANEFFDELKSRYVFHDGIVNATFMEYFFSKGNPKEAMKYYKSYTSLFDKIGFKILPATCNTLLSVLLKWNRKQEAETLFDTMLDKHNHPSFHAVNSDTFNIMVNECFKNGKGSDAYSVFTKVGKAPKSKAFSMTTSGYNNIIMRYCENDMLEDAEKIYVEFSSKSLSQDANIYKTLIEAYFKSGKIDEAVEKFMKMADLGLRVLPTNANKWFNNMIENEKIMECVYILSKMVENDPKPDASSYDIVIRALCEVSDYDTSLCLLQQLLRSPALKEYVLDVFEKAGVKLEFDQYNSGFGNYNGNQECQKRSEQVKLIM